MDLIFHLTYLFSDFSSLHWGNKTESNRPSTGLVTSQPSSHSALESVALCHCGSPRGITLQVNKYWPEPSSRKLAWLIAVATLSQHSCTWWTTVETQLTNVLSITRIVSYCRDWVATLHWLVGLQMSRHTSQSGRRPLFFTLALVLSQLPFNRSINSW